MLPVDAWPDRLVPPERKVTALAGGGREREQRGHLGRVVGVTTARGVSR